MKVSRLLRMSPGELVGRGRQELARRLDRWIEESGSRSGGSRQGRTVSPEQLRRLVAERFFPGPTAPGLVALLTERFPHLVDGLVEKADSVLAGRFDLLGHKGLSFGDPIDWHREPLAGRRAPLVHWSRLDPLDSATVGDSKVVWELNRHQWLVWLGLAYVLTNDERYTRCFIDRLRHWKRENPVGLGINWTSSLELALRIVAWCWALALFRESASLTSEFVEEVSDSVDAQARHVERYLSRYFSPNTHLTGEGLGLLYAGIAFPQLPRAARWRRLGAMVLNDELQRQILDDGVYFEQSACYQRYTVEIGLHFLVLAARNDIDVPAGVRERVERALEVFLFWQRPDSSMPHIGDTDGGSLLALWPRVADDYRGVFAVAAAIYRRNDFAWAAGGMAPEVVWMLGRAGAETFESLELAPPVGPASRAFPLGGYVVMRSSWDREAHHLIFDVGPLGCRISGGHGHADLLSIQCVAFGEPYLVDPGTYSYAEPFWRAALRGTAAHSALLVDGQGQAKPVGLFKWDARPSAKLVAWSPDRTWEIAEGEHHAYEHLADPVRIRRRVVFVERRYWVVVDELEGEGEHRVEARFQLAPMPVELGHDLWVRARGSRGRGMLLRTFADLPLGTAIHEGDPERGGWSCPDYGQLLAAPSVTWSTVSRLPLRLLTLLLPVEDIDASPPVVELLRDEGRLAGLVFCETGERVWALGTSPTVDRG